MGNRIGVVEVTADEQITKTRKSSFQHNYSTSNSFNSLQLNKRISRRSCSKSALNNSLNFSKTCWPVSTVESLFRPHFTVENDFNASYDKVDYISKGAFGKVWKVSEKSSNKIYALKSLDKARIIDEGSINQIKDEVKIQTLCGHHPFIVNCISYWQSKKYIFLLNEFISEGELFQTINKFTYQLVQLYIAEIAVALDFLHNAGVIYRDLKPENILLDNDYHIKLTDFGLSKWLKIGCRTNSICGTLNYMAPEILSGNSYSHSVDYWALGVLAHRMITNTYPPWCCDDLPPPRVRANDAIQAGLEEDDDDRYSLALPLPLCSDGAFEEHRYALEDLLQRLLQRDEKTRLRSILALQRIAFYKDYNIQHVKQKTVSPRKLLEERRGH